ncbi:MAG: hypothetical protein RL695_1616, partial [Pseudomonadota bacterium]
MLKIGQSAPLFTLFDADMESFSFASFHGSNHVVLF